MAVWCGVPVLGFMCWGCVGEVEVEVEEVNMIWVHEVSHTGGIDCCADVV